MKHNSERKFNENYLDRRNIEKYLIHGNHVTTGGETPSEKPTYRTGVVQNADLKLSGKSCADVWKNMPIKPNDCVKDLWMKRCQVENRRARRDTRIHDGEFDECQLMSVNVSDTYVCGSSPRTSVYMHCITSYGNNVRLEFHGYKPYLYLRVNHISLSRIQHHLRSTFRCNISVSRAIERYFDASVFRPKKFEFVKIYFPYLKAKDNFQRKYFGESRGKPFKANVVSSKGTAKLMKTFPEERFKMSIKDWNGVHSVDVPQTPDLRTFGSKGRFIFGNTP